MATLVLTLVGTDRAGLVAALARVIDAHDGNWERSELAELAGTFAGVVEVSVPAAGLDGLREALAAIDGLVTVSLPGSAAAIEPGDRRMVFQVLGNDHPGIVHEISAALSARGVGIERLTTETRDAAMAGGRLFEAEIDARVPAATDLDALRADLERLAAELQVDVAVLG
jgi:glycine cleavage system regulatory protein